MYQQKTKHFFAHIPQKYYGIITPSDSFTCAGLCSYGMGPCSGIAVVGGGYIYLCHADDQTDLGDKNHGMPAWINNIRVNLGDNVSIAIHFEDKGNHPHSNYVRRFGQQPNINLYPAIREYEPDGFAVMRDSSNIRVIWDERVDLNIPDGEGDFSHPTRKFEIKHLWEQDTLAGLIIEGIKESNLPRLFPPLLSFRNLEHLQIKCLLDLYPKLNTIKQKIIECCI